MVKNKKIFETVPTPIFETLRDNQQVILKKALLPKPRHLILKDFSKILEVFQNASFIGELRERWLLIKKLQQGETISAATA